MKPIEITITLEDFKLIPENENERFFLYIDVNNCPLANAIKKAGISDNPSVDFHAIKNSFDKSTELGFINPPFYKSDFDDLLDKKIDVFVTTYTPKA